MIGLPETTPLSGMPRGAGRPAAPVGIVTALPEEGEVLLELLENAVSVRPETRNFEGLPRIRSGWLGGVPAAVAVTGDGRRNALEGVEIFLDAVAVEWLLVIGVGGGLAPELEPGAILLASEVWLDGAVRYAPALDRLERARRLTGARVGVVVTVDDLLDSAEAKADALARLRRSGALDGPAMADLETAHYVARAEARGIPWLVLRGVSDDATEELPSFLNQCRDEGGAVRRSAIVRHAFLHPMELPELVRLRRRVRCCAEKLATSARRLVREEAA